MCRLLCRTIHGLLPVFALVGCATGVLAANSAPLRIVAFGDSTTAPRVVAGKPLVVYADLLRQELPTKGFDVQVINAGVPGNSTDDGRRRFERDVLAAKPQLVIIQFGANDSAIDVWREPPAKEPRVAIDRFEANLRWFVAELRQRGIRVVLMTPDPFRWTELLKKMYGKPPYDPNDPDGFSILLEKYADTVRWVAREMDVPLVDPFAAFGDYGDLENHSVDELLLDGMHPNARGHRLIADLLVEEVLKQGSK